MARKLVEYLAQNLSSNPQQVRTGVEHSDDDLCIKLRVAEEDRGRVIGKGGSNARALRSIVKAAGAIHDETYKLEIED